MTTAVITEVDGIFVVRDDLIPGGTKARVLPAYLDAISAGEMVVYASPAYGYAQVALAHAAKQTGREAVVFTAKRTKPHLLTLEARAQGARVVQVPSGYLSNVQSKARDYCAATGATMLPFGFDDLRFVKLLADVADSVLPEAEQVWCVGGSGTLARALHTARPDAELHVVQVGRRLDLSFATVHEAPEDFERPARRPPPFPSCANYDAKAWRFVSREAAPGSVFWNVAA